MRILARSGHIKFLEIIATPFPRYLKPFFFLPFPAIGSIHKNAYFCPKFCLAANSRTNDFWRGGRIRIFGIAVRSRPPTIFQFFL